MKKWYVSCEYSDGEYWHDFSQSFESPTLMQAIVLGAIIVVADLSSEKVVAFLNFQVEEEEESK